MPPAIEGRRADTEVTARQASIVAVVQVEVHPAEALPRLARELWGNPKPLGLRQERLLDIHRASVAPPDRFEPPFAPQHPSGRVFRIYLNLLS